MKLLHLKLQCQVRKKGKKIYFGDKVELEAKNIEKLIFVKGKLTISEASPFEGFKYPSVSSWVNTWIHSGTTLECKQKTLMG